MTSQGDIEESFNTSGKGFAAEVNRRGTTLNINLTGRLDTITSPELLKLYKSAAKDGEIKRININMRKLDYVSSAGIRVILIMYKNLPSNGNMTINNANDTVKAVFDTMGISSTFGL